jgi:hypothetical protein
MKLNRRQLLTAGAAAGAAALAPGRAFAQQPDPPADHVAGKEKPRGDKPVWMRDPHPEPASLANTTNQRDTQWHYRAVETRGWREGLSPHRG